ncbi:hypothetical protein SADUNF_Sadunf16G0111500 [Salix dunnii]|uniref:Uncharacterized protein n=1 Tax=Salix dunnii TaxID=1413687 RepID=A0A835MIT8_9ROSI|nr:hypothetical protein SADUNF_Sadunf16G0111500 [Salix dunnii]
MEKQGTCITNSCTHSERHFLLESRLLPPIDFVGFTELVLHVPFFPIMITTTPILQVHLGMHFIQDRESPPQELNSCMQNSRANQ